MESIDSSQMMSNADNDGQKRCKCRKTMCLKLNCDCFAAGLYCAKSCSCQGCFNSPDYKDTVDQTRELIRSPLGYSPKIHDHSVEGVRSSTRIVGKRKRGCQCMVSMCVQRYCKCYRTNVGCSDKCECQGCKNVYGKRGEDNKNTQSGSMTVAAIHETGEKEVYVPEFEYPQSLTPSMLFGHVGHENNASTSGGYIPSIGYGNSEMITLDQQSYPNVEFTNQFTSPNNTDIDVYGKRGEDNMNTVIYETDKKEVYLPEFDNPESLTPSASFGHMGYENIASTSGSYIPSLGYDDYDMIPLDQQSYPTDEFINQFTASNNTDIDVGHPDFMTIQSTPIAGKHMKSCNCKISRCMLRYCQCYQANVRCSSECQYEGCKNV